MADLDEISMLLGEIRSDMKHVLNWQVEHERADQTRFEELSSRMTVNNGYRFRLESLEDTLENFKPIMAHLTNAKWLAIGALVTIGAIGGAIGGWALSLAKMIL